MKRSRALLAALAVAVVAGGSGTASGSVLRSPSPVSSGLINGCWSTKAVNGSHVLVLQDQGTPCPGGTTPISWNQTGPTGPAGAEGRSAYQVWQTLAGNAGKTVDQYLASLVGPRGAAGDPGKNGSDGLSAFQIWAAQDGNGSKSVADFLASLVGPQGAAGTAGGDGLSAYDIWVRQGHSGTVDAFLASLVGPTGANGTNGMNGMDGANGSDGLSAFQVWQQLPGNEGKSVADFFAALRGDKGDKGDKGDTGDTGPQGPPGAAGAGLTSLDALGGLPCRVGTPQAGTTTVGYAADGTVSLSCVATTRYTLTVTLAGTGTGAVTSSPAGLTCSGTTCTGSFPSGTPVTVTATPGGSRRFDGWSGACTNPSGTCAVTMSADRAVTASFTPVALLAVTVANAISPLNANPTNSVVLPDGTFCSATGSGSTHQCTATVPVGQPLTLTRSASSAMPLDHWTGCSSASGDTCTVTLTTGGGSVRADFKAQ